MRKIYTLAAFVIATGIFLNCNPSKKITGTPTENTTETVTSKLSYNAELKNVIAANCSPCHFPDKGGIKKAYDNYANVKSDINEMIRRISLNPDEKGFMPFKKAKLGDSTIAVFKQWRDDGMVE
jgi:hypothetical protein